MNKNITPEEAIRNAQTELGLDSKDCECTNIKLNENLYEINIQTICMKYFLYVDSDDGLVLGISSEPFIDLGLVYSDS